MAEAADAPDQSSLTDRIMVGLERRFLQYGHRPSPAHWKGLRAIAATIEAQALGTAEPKFYLSSLPTGMGKTTTVAEAVKALVSDPTCKQIGVVLFVNQLNQIPRLIGEMELNDDQFAVRTGVDNENLNALGLNDHANAQVLFTTQQKLPHLLRYRKNFSEMPFFKFRGAPRQVRIWDEAILPAEPLTFTVKQFEEVAVSLTKIGQHGASARLHDWALKQLPLFASGSITEMPSLIPELNWEALKKLEQENDLLRNVVWMSGQDVRLHKDDFSGATTISYRENLPREFAPLLVLDASGSLRLTYELWEKGRGNLKELLSPGKTYRNLTIHHWDHAAGKFAHQDESKVEILVEGIARAVTSIPPNEEVLIIVRKQEDASHPNLEVGIKAKAGRREGLHFLTWGKHTATNDYADVRHVIVVGALQYGYAQNEAMARGAAGLSIQDAISKQDVERVRLGEISHHLFQAVGRGAVRKSVEGDCPVGCHLWIVTSSLGKAPVPLDLLETLFPQARLEKWLPVKAPLKQSEAAVVDAVEGYLADKNETTISLREIADQAGYSWNTVMRRLKEQKVVEELRRREIRADKPDRNSAKGVVRLSRPTHSLNSLQLPIKGSNKNLK